MSVCRYLSLSVNICSVCWCLSVHVCLSTYCSKEEGLRVLSYIIVHSWVSQNSRNLRSIEDYIWTKTSELLNMNTFKRFSRDFHHVSPLQYVLIKRALGSCFTEHLLVPFRFYFSWKSLYFLCTFVRTLMKNTFTVFDDSGFLIKDQLSWTPTLFPYSDNFPACIDNSMESRQTMSHFLNYLFYAISAYNKPLGHFFIQVYFQLLRQWSEFVGLQCFASWWKWWLKK